MGDLADVYEATRKEVARTVSSLSEEQLHTRVPATPEWTIKDVVSHLTGDVACVNAGDFPREFFEAFGSDHGVISLNRWTAKQVDVRRDTPLQEVLQEWDQATPSILPMLRGEAEWPEGVLPFAGHILLADIATHQQDILGALNVARFRDAPQVRIAVATFIGGVGLRLQMSGGPGLRFAMEDKEVPVGGDEPQATVRAPRFELFRALSGRRNPDQVKAYTWEGDPEPYIPFFYPYGVRQEALVE